MAFSIQFNSTAAPQFSYTLRQILVRDVPTDTTPVEVELKNGGTSILKTTLYSVNGSIDVGGIRELIEANIDSTQNKHAIFTASAKCTISGTNTIVTATVLAFLCRVSLGSVNCSSFLASHFMTMSPTRVVPRNFSFSIYSYRSAQVSIPAVIHFVYDDGTSYDAVTPYSSLPVGVSHITLSYSTLAALQPYSKKICSIDYRIGSYRITLFVSDSPLTDIGYTNVFGHPDHLYIRTYRNETVEREYQKTRMDDFTTRIYDAQTTDKVELKLNPVSNSELNVIREIIQIGEISTAEGDYLIVDHSWNRNNIPGSNEAVTLSLEPISCTPSIPVSSAGIFTEQYTEQYE